MESLSNSFNEKFCANLEYHLGKTFENSNQNNLKRFWCDGVSWNPIPDVQLSKKSINDNRKIITKAWIGNNGQDEYVMTIQFGKYSLRRYAKGHEIIDCIPSSESTDWLDIDTANRKIEIRLK